ncbi:MAG: NAD(P)-dependent oxidoreductase [Ilumatobacter sp.]
MRLRRRSSVLLVTGASGFLGRHLIRSPRMDRWQLIAPSSTAMDVADEGRTVDTISAWKPDAVIHLAYDKDDHRVTANGSRNVAQGAAKARARLVHVSSDAVFGGRSQPYVEADIPDPITRYGASKRDAEDAVAEVAPRAAIVRTSLLYGTDYLSAFQRKLKADLEASRPAMTLYADEFRCPAHAEDVAAALLRLAEMRDRSGPIHVAGPERLSRLRFADACAKFAGFDHANLPAKTIAETGTTRPADVELDSTLATGLGLGCRPISEALR